MEVWHFCASPVDPDHETGGVSNVVRALSLQSALHDIKTTVVCGSHELGQPKAPPAVRDKGPNLRIITLNSANALGQLLSLRRLVRSIPMGSAVHVHAGFSLFADAAMIFLRRQRQPYVFSPHGKLSAGMLRTRRRAKAVWWGLTGRANANGARLIGVGAAGETELFGDLGLTTRAVAIPNGYSRTVARGPLPPPAGIEGRYLLFLGYLDPRKQPGLLIRAFALSRSCKDVRLLLVGPDGYGHRSELEALALSLGVSDRVIFHGPAYGEAKWALLEHAIALALPSLAEGMPLVLVEAAGAGTPSLFSRRSNGQLFAEAGAGIEVEGEQPADWAAALDKVVEDDGLRARMATAASHLATSLTWDAVGASWQAIYSDMARPTAGRSD